jgi:hypothetical protein
MNWNNLNKNKCPKCAKDLSGTLNVNTEMFECSCGFKISSKRFQEIVTNKNKQKVELTQEQIDEEDNFD